MSLWKDRRPGRGQWLFSFQYRGKRYTGGGHAKKSEARAAMEKRRAEVKEEEKRTRRGMDCRTAFSLYLDWSERKHAKKTYEYKKMVLQTFQKHVKPETVVVEITPQMISSYLLKRPTAHNYNVHRKEIRAFFNWFQKTVKPDFFSPVSRVDTLPEEKKEKVIPSEQDVLKLLMAADPEERTLLLVVMHTLGRIDEILRLTWQDVNFERRRVTLWTRKRKDGTWARDDLYMNDDLYGILKGLWEKRRQEKWVFYNEKTGSRYNRRPKFIKGLCKRAKVEPFGFHALRHYVATLLSDSEKVGTKTVSRLLRHMNVRTTEIYLHSIPTSEMEALKVLEGKWC